jgi:crotonobetainyl-CoA:carnitine CoA-transferase CaiB-like acyl-CoA transferase
VPHVGNPIQFSRSRIEYRSAPPVLGEHTEQVLGELLGLTPGEVASLKGRDVVRYFWGGSS